LSSALRSTSTRSTTTTPDDPPIEIVQEVAVGLAFALPIGIGLSLLIGRRLTRSTTDRLDEVISTAARLSGESLHERLPIGPDGDALDDLSIALNGAFERIEAGVGAQRQFAADASHELRTPIAVMLTNLEIARRKPRENAHWENVADGVLDELRRVTRLVDKLLMLARTGDTALHRAQTHLRGIRATPASAPSRAPTLPSTSRSRRDVRRGHQLRSRRARPSSRRQAAPRESVWRTRSARSLAARLTVIDTASQLGDRTMPEDPHVARRRLDHRCDLLRRATFGERQVDHGPAARVELVQASNERARGHKDREHDCLCEVARAVLVTEVLATVEVGTGCERATERGLCLAGIRRARRDAPHERCVLGDVPHPPANVARDDRGFSRRAHQLGHGAAPGRRRDRSCRA